MGSSVSKSNNLLCRLFRSSSANSVRSLTSRTMEEFEVCNSSELLEEGMKSFDVKGQKILLAKHKGSYFAVGNKCSHYGAPLDKGTLCNGIVRCPWHGACFDLKTGDIEDFPGLDSLPTFDVFEKDDKIFIRADESQLSLTKRVKNMAKRDPENSQRYVIVGGGAASAKCVETLRQEGFTGEIVLLTKESDLPYDRPKLTKAMHLESSKILLRSEEFYKDNDIDIRRNSEVTKIDTESKTVYTNDNTISFDKLFLATGGSPRKLNCPGSDLKGIYVIREPSEANEVAENAKDKQVVVVGASFIGAEVAAYLSMENRCSNVTVINNVSVPFERSLGPDIGARIMNLFEDNGVQFKNNVSVVAVNGEDKVTGVSLSNGETIDADIVVLGIGVIPTTDFLTGSNIELNDHGFVTVDKFMETNVKDIYCGGDIASFPLFLEDSHVSIGHWQIAHKHGQVAALNMVGKEQELHTVPFFWTVLYGKSLRYTGYGKYDDIIITGNLEDLSFVAYYCRGEKVVAVASLMKDPAVANYAEMLKAGRYLKKDDVLSNQDIIFNTI